MIEQVIADLFVPRCLHPYLKDLRHLYFKNRLKKFPKLSVNEFENIIVDQLGVTTGSVVFVHSSLDGLNINFLGFKILSILLIIVGTGGTLLFPTSHLRGRAEDFLKKGVLFDVNHSPTKMGIIPEFARRHKNAYRSLHPTHSVVAIGKYAKELISSHSESIHPCDRKSPYFKIIKYNPIIIGLGVSTSRLTYLNCVEDVLEKEFPVKTRTTNVFKCQVYDCNGKQRIIKTTASTRRDNWGNNVQFINKYIPKEIASDFTIKGVKFFMAKGSLLYNEMVHLATKGITRFPKFIYSKY